MAVSGHGRWVIAWILSVVLVIGISACDSGDASPDIEPEDGDRSEGEADPDGDRDLEMDGDLDAEGDLPIDGDTDLAEATDGDGELELAEGETEIESENGGDAEPDEPEVLRCNGFSELCERRYDEVAYVTAHNAMSNKDDGWVAPNQIHGITQQLEDGVRGFMLDTYYYESEVWLCHGDCEFGKAKLVDVLGEFAAFLASHPDEVLTLIFENNVSDEDMAAVFDEAGLMGDLHTQSADGAWPTLGEMIASGRRLVVFTDQLASGPDWCHYVWDYCWDTPWRVMQLEDFSCNLGRGSRSNSLFILNHMLYGSFDLPSQQQSELANANPFFSERAQGCHTETGQLPNFITVDFYSIGDVFDVVDALNGVLQAD